MKLKEYKDKYFGDRFYGECFIENVYNPQFTILDIGALAGEYSFWMYPMIKESYAIEPEQKQYDELEANIKEFEFPNVKPFHLAIMGRNGTTNVVPDARGGARGGFRTLFDGSDNSQQVEAKTLATFIKENKIQKVDILKIDVEGAEGEIFRADDFWEVADKIKLIIGEHLSSSKEDLIKLGFREVGQNGGNIIFRHD